MDIGFVPVADGEHRLNALSMANTPGDFTLNMDETACSKIEASQNKLDGGKSETCIGSSVNSIDTVCASLATLEDKTLRHAK